MTDKPTLSGFWLIGPDLGDPADAAKHAKRDRFMQQVDAEGFQRLGISDRKGRGKGQ